MYESGISVFQQKIGCVNWKFNGYTEPVCGVNTETNSVANGVQWIIGVQVLER